MIVDQAPEGGKFRAVAAAALDGEAGVWGSGDMLCVQFDGSGDLILAAAGDNFIGVIKTNEGRKDLGLATDKEVIGGRKYTVFTNAEFTEVDIAASPTMAAGAVFYATALGDLIIEASATLLDRYVGTVVGGRFLVHVGARPSAPA